MTNDAGGVTARGGAGGRVERAAHAFPLGGFLYHEVEAPGGLIRRVGRALQLDPSLYREVAAPGASTWQAVLVAVLTAGIAGVGWGAGAFHLLATDEPAVRYMEQLVAEFSAVAGLSALVHITAWPVWAAGLWVVSRRFRAAGVRPKGSGRLPACWPLRRRRGLFAVLIPIVAGSLWLGRVDPDVEEGSPLGLLVFGIRATVGVWILLGTFLATHEVLRLSYGRTLGALVGVAAGVGFFAVLLGIIVTGVSNWENHAWVDSLGTPSVFDVTHGFDLNLGLSFSDAAVGFVLRLVEHARF